MIDPQALLADLKRQVSSLRVDLREQAVGNLDLEQEWREAYDARRTGADYQPWLGERITQVAVAWILGTVFVRFCEDNDLIEFPVIAGPGNRAAVAWERQEEFLHEHKELTDRDWIKQGFKALSVSPVAAALFESHNPMWEIPLSHDAAKALLSFWRRTDADGVIVHDFTDPEWDTRFLGDLYQHLSEDARKTYALLQTPEFVEEFILAYTLDPAIEEFGLEPEPPIGHQNLPCRFRFIDPACGSGHFLLGAFDRILKAWKARSGDTDTWTLIRRALESIHGIDKNPFAVAVARFRLMIAAMKEGRVETLKDPIDFRIFIAVGDSLLHGKGAPGIQGEFDFGGRGHVHTYRTEDVDDYIKSVNILEFGSYHAVVGNPPYITVKDKQENDNYRKAYKSCSGKYALSVPFAERIFQLAIRGAQGAQIAGYTGQITSNSFMKREFGKKLIEEFFPTVNLTHIIDTSGAYIPGHGTPTVVLYGRRRFPRPDSTIRAVLGVRGEPALPEDPALGLVWQAIVHQVDHPGSETEWVTAADLIGSHFAHFPWSLSGGGARDVTKALVGASARRLKEIVDSVGITSVTGEDDLYLLPRSGAKMRLGIDDSRLLVTGDVVRDFVLVPNFDSVWTYDSSFNVMPLKDMPGTRRFLTPFRAAISHRRRFGIPMLERGLTWYEWQELYVEKLRIQMSITYAEVATHNHFVLDRGGKVFKQTAPVIKLSETASEDDYLVLLGVLNSSTACFWLKQVSHKKGGANNSGGGRSDQPWSWSYQFNGTKLDQFPLPAQLPLEFGRELDRLARRLAEIEPSAVCGVEVPSREALDAASVEHERIRGRMIALQEELDWDVYRRYGLLDEPEAAGLVVDSADVPELRVGERAFEIVLARKVAAGEVETQWFARHGSTQVLEIPAYWPQAYKDVVARRIVVIERDRNIGLIERPECKRRWQSETWEDKERKALTGWLLDRCENKSLWYGPEGQPVPMTVNRLADRLRSDRDVVAVARLLNGPDADLADVLKEIIANEHVPYLAQLRYRGEGLLKRTQWEKTWQLQRQEDASDKELDIPVPPKYKSSDFVEASFWRQRGKLDVPRERFISYPYSNPDGDDTLLLGWAGWDHREQAFALISLVEERASTDGWGIDRIKPLLVGLAEVMPWVRQWHNDTDDLIGESPADAYDRYLLSQQEKYGLTADDLRAWNPPAPSRGRRG